MDKFRLAHTTKPPKIVKPIQKPKPKYFQKKIKELLTGIPASSGDIRQDKSREDAVKFLTNETGGKVKDRSSLLHSLKKKSSKTKKKIKDVEPHIHRSKDTKDEHVNIKRRDEHSLHKQNVVSSPKQHLSSIESGKHVAEEAKLGSFPKTNESKSVQKHNKTIAENAVSQIISPKTDLHSQVSTALDISNKNSPKTGSSKTKENTSPIKRKEKQITETEHLRAKKSKKKKHNKNKKWENISSASLETKVSQNVNPLDPNKDIENRDNSSRQTGKIEHLRKKNVPTFLCKKSLISKGENTRPNLLLKTKKKTKKDKVIFKETKQNINYEEEKLHSNSCLQGNERNQEKLSSNPSILPISGKKSKKKKKRKMQLKSASGIDSTTIIIEDISELNNNITFKEVDIVHSPIIENKESKKKKVFKKKREAHPSTNTISENLESISTPLECLTLEISEVGALSQNVNPKLEEAVTNSGFNVEDIEIEEYECSTTKATDLNFHKKWKENDIEPNKVVSSPRTAAKQESGITLKGKKTKNLKEKLDSKETLLETYGGFIVDIEEPKGQPHSSSGEQQLDSAPLVVNAVNGAKPPSVLEIFHITDNIPSPEKEIHSIIQEFIPDVSEAQSIFSKAYTKKNRKSQKQTSSHDTSAAILSTTQHKTKPRKRKFTGEDKYPENINVQQEDSTKNKILSEPLVISASTKVESFQIPSLLAAKTDEPHTLKKHVADMHSVIQFLLGSQEKDSFFETSLSSNSELKGKSETFENAGEPAFLEKSMDGSSSTKALELENPVKENSKSAMQRKKLSENTDNRMESTMKNEYTEVLQDVEKDEHYVTKENVFEPLVVEMADVELPKIPAIFDRLLAVSDSATEEVHSNSLIEHFIPTSFQDEHFEEKRPAEVVSIVNDVVTKKKENHKKQQKQPDELIDDAETEEDSVKVYSIPNCSRFLLLMKYPSLLFFKGKLAISVLSGLIEVLGYVMKSEDNVKHIVYSPKGSSLMSIETCESDENNVVNYVSLMETLVKIGMDTSVTKDILSNLGQRDCLIILEEGPTNKLEEFVKKLPPDMHFFDVSNENRRERNPMSCLYQAQKKLGCIFELPSSDKSFRRYTKSPQWDVLVQDIISCNKEHLQKGPVSTVVCGGKGVGKSTFLRYFVNKCIIEFGKVLWLDFDPGQAEFVMPGCVAAVVIEEPLLGPNFTHLKKPERMVFVGDVNISQCPIQYLESVWHVINYCRSRPELRRLPWLVNTMGFCKGLGIDLTTSIIRLLKPLKVVQIQSESFKRNFPQLLSPEYAASYPSIWRTGPPPGSVTLNYDIHVINTMTDSRLAENTGQWGMEPRRLREAMILAYLSQMVKPPGYSIFDIGPYITPFHRLTLCICHRPVQYAHMLSAMNGNLVALCYYDGYEALVPNDPKFPKVMNRQPVCPCLGFGIVRGIDTTEKNLFLITPLPLQDLQQVNCLMMGAIMLPAYLYTTAENGMGRVPYVSAGPGQPTSKVIRRFFRPLEEKPIRED